MDVTRPIRLVILSVVLFCVITESESAKFRSRNEQVSELGSALIDPLYNFTSNLFSNLNRASKSNESENIIVSPLSIHKAFSMTLLGTDETTETGRELVNTLGYSGLSSKDLLKYHTDYERMMNKFANVSRNAIKSERAEGESGAQFMRKNNFGDRAPLIDMFNMVITKNDKAALKDSYRRDIKTHYKSSVEKVNDNMPGTKSKILHFVNKWGKEAGFESAIMSPDELDKEFNTMLLSAVRLQAFWPEKFHESQGKAIFYNNGLKSKPVNGTKLSRMKVPGVQYLKLSNEKSSDKLREQMGDLSQLNAQIVQVPLEGGLSYTIFEPLEHSTSGDNKLKQLVMKLFEPKKMALKKLVKMLDDRDYNEYKVSLTMPKFKFESELSIDKVLMSMGLKKVFDARSAEITRMTTKNVYLSEVKHQAMIEVNDKGIKAAGITKLGFQLMSLPPDRRPSIDVTINKPFVLLIRYGEIPLFVGQLSSM